MTIKAYATGLLAVAISCGCSTVSKDDDPYVLKVSEGQIHVSKKKWRKMDDPEAYAKNFEARVPDKGSSSHVVTTFLLPMTPDRKLGERITAREYLQIIWHTLGNTERISIRVRVDRGSYWILSNQIMEVPEMLRRIAKSRGGSEEVMFHEFRLHFQNEIDKARFMLAAEFAPHPR